MELKFGVVAAESQRLACGVLVEDPSSSGECERSAAQQKGYSDDSAVFVFSLRWEGKKQKSNKKPIIPWRNARHPPPSRLEFETQILLRWETTESKLREIIK